MHQAGLDGPCGKVASIASGTGQPVDADEQDVGDAAGL